MNREKDSKLDFEKTYDVKSPVFHNDSQKHVKKKSYAPKVVLQK